MALAAPLAGVPAHGQGPLTIGIDANTEGNGPVSLGSVDSCLSVGRHHLFDVDIFIRDVDELLAWEIYVGYDPAILEVQGRDVKMFLAGNPGSSVIDVSGRLAEAGLYPAAAADTSDPPTPDSGSGVLFRLHFKALKSGKSKMELVSRDINGDGRADQGPLLRNVDGEALGDTNGDAIFDGPIANAEIAVDAACDGGPGPGTPTDGSDSSSGSGPALIIAAALGGTLVLLAAGLVAFRLIGRPRAGPE